MIIQKPNSQVRYLLRFAANDRFTLAEFYDGAFTETLLEVRREDGGFFLEKISHHYNAKITDTKRIAPVPFDTFDSFFAQLESFCPFTPDKVRLKGDSHLMRFLCLKD